MQCGTGKVEQRAAVQYREKMWRTLGQEHCLLQELIHHTGVCKCQPLPLPLLCRAEGSQLLPHQEQQGREGTKPSIPCEPSAQPMEHQPPAAADSGSQGDHQQSMTGFLLSYLARGCEAVCRSQQAGKAGW